MLYLAENYRVGIAVCCAVVCVVYVSYSVLVAVYARKRGLGVCAAAFVPVYNLSIPIRVKLLKRKKLRKSRVSRGSNVEENFKEFSENDEIQL